MTWLAMIRSAIAGGIGLLLIVEAVGATDVAVKNDENADNRSAAATVDPQASRQKRRLPISDVALGAGGQLTGWVVDAEGRPVGKSPVVLLQNGHQVAQAVTDARGQFQVPRLRGGVYQIVAAQGGGVYRLWAPATAPPSAGVGLMIVTRGEVVRGQIPYRDLFASDRVLHGGVVAGAIAVPVAIYNNHGSGS
jgi:hypothetical protein